MGYPLADDEERAEVLGPDSPKSLAGPRGRPVADHTASNAVAATERSSASIAVWRRAILGG